MEVSAELHARVRELQRPDSLDDLDDAPDEPLHPDQDADEDDDGLPGVPHTGYGLYDARAEAEKW
ncbi:hypothetical protein OG978_44800 (plasmid) [Streptomyces sp. NBC_01591]|uniref:hypothetical protein n=1 Tax=Streptomyces sp. NBC_01591 TaxID=2975888 RepID=UPI002DDC8949|nr:hypothetical protein [Streptomyces sp. NBC_01591]WSD74228.1 hypothetical protein OG978_44800 [Streptomyces sp. NBC_01591]